MLTLCLVKLSESKSFENRVPIMSLCFLLLNGLYDCLQCNGTRHFGLPLVLNIIRTPSYCYFDSCVVTIYFCLNFDCKFIKCALVLGFYIFFDRA